jgi:hypothetical protein
MRFRTARFGSLQDRFWHGLRQLWYVIRHNALWFAALLWMVVNILLLVLPLTVKVSAHTDFQSCS